MGKNDATEVFNRRHRNTQYEGWSVLDKTVWQKLAPFKNFMTAWFGESYDANRTELMVLYHADANRLDICMCNQDTHVSIECARTWLVELILDFVH